MRFEAIIATTEEDAYGYSFNQADLAQLAKDAPGQPVTLFFDREICRVTEARAEPDRVKIWCEAERTAAGLYAIPQWHDEKIVGVGLVRVPLDPFLTPVKEVP